jgi:putative endonuclease
MGSINFFKMLSRSRKSPNPMTIKKTEGQRGEEIACKALKKKGYRILDKNFSCRHGELDIVAEDEDVVCFIEVKARSSEDYGLPEEAVTHWKRRKLLNTAFVYIEKKKIKDRDMRFDIISVDLKTREARILKDAFEADL